MKIITAHRPTLFRSGMTLFMTAILMLLLAACERSQPTPDPAPAPPTPQTWLDDSPATVHRAVFTYPGPGAMSMHPARPGQKLVRT